MPPVPQTPDQPIFFTFKRMENDFYR